jgi:hypothetical protein
MSPKSDKSSVNNEILWIWGSDKYGMLGQANIKK